MINFKTRYRCTSILLELAKIKRSGKGGGVPWLSLSSYHLKKKQKKGDRGEGEGEGVMIKALYHSHKKNIRLLEIKNNLKIKIGLT